jgi:hypothetical protein
MWGYIWSILALGALCAAWVLFQRWLERVDPQCRRIEDGGGCGGKCSGNCGKT